MAVVAASPWWKPPVDEDGRVDLVQAAAHLSLFVNEVGGYINTSSSICAEMREQLPPRGPLTDLFGELLEVLAFVEAKWAYLDDALLSTAMLMRIEDGRE